MSSSVLSPAIYINVVLSHMYLFGSHLLVDNLDGLFAGAEVEPALDVGVGRERESVQS